MEGDSNLVSSDVDESFFGVGSDFYEQARILSNLLSTFEESLSVQLKGDEDRENDDNVSSIRNKTQQILQVPLCRLAKLLIPNVQRKIDEIVVASDLDMIVSKSEHGADMVDDLGNSFELKVSICTKNEKKPSENYKSNIIWPIPPKKNGEDISKVRVRLLEQVSEKTNGEKGGAIFILKTKSGVELNRYFFSGRFLLDYFEHLPLKDGAKNHNFGSARCLVCEKYHRLERMLKWDKEKRPIENGECEIYKSISSQCKVLT